MLEANGFKIYWKVQSVFHVRMEKQVELYPDPACQHCAAKEMTAAVQTGLL